MTPDQDRTHAHEGDLALLAGPRQKHFIVRLKHGESLQTHRGILKHDELIGLPWGSMVYSHLGRTFVLLVPSLTDLLQQTKRNTQIMYAKDIGFILMMMNIGPGQHVLEAGTGSGAFTTALARMVGPGGQVTSYEIRPEMQKLAQKNIRGLGLEERVTFKLRDIREGFDEQGVDALFLDLPNPYDFVEQVRSALKPGGFFGTILPTMNQVTRLLSALQRGNFVFVEVCEIMLRYYQAIPERLRPTDRMVAHTGYLIFARPILPPKDVPDLEEGFVLSDSEKPEEVLHADDEEAHLRREG
jgi:tRNA (adenine57-N1/adenine58-N1)-methyltransferase catalytic subunit